MGVSETTYWRTVSEINDIEVQFKKFGNEIASFSRRFASKVETDKPFRTKVIAGGALVGALVVAVLVT
jgi:hypothetical protein